MRIDNWPVIATENRIDAGSLLSRLSKGDVIRAVVLETSLAESVLRLSDGSVIRAATGDDVEIKEGQILKLAVKLKTDTIIELETVKDSSSEISPDLSGLYKMLEKLNIKPDETNLKVAGEFLKYGIKPDAGDILRAAELIGSSESMDAEKAVYITAKNINTAGMNIETLAAFLDGDMKLGSLLDALNKALGENSGVSAGASQDHIPVSAHTSSAAHTSAVNTSASAPETYNANTTAHMPANTYMSGLERTPESVPEPAAIPVPIHVPDSAVISSSDHAPANVQVNTDMDEAHINADNKGFPDIKDMDGNAETTDIKNIKSKKDLKELTGGNKPSDNVSELKASIKKLFVKISKDLSAEDLDVSKTMEKTAELLKKADTLLKSTERNQANENALRTTTAAIDSFKLLDTLNASNVYYYQLPIDISGNRTTAELYVMRRRKGGRKIDPQDAVLFLSLDTANLGRVEALTEIKGNSISINLRTESKAVNDFIKANISSLYSGLSECGRKLVSVRYSITGAAAAPCAQEKILQEIVKMKHERVDLRI